MPHPPGEAHPEAAPVQQPKDDAAATTAKPTTGEVSSAPQPQATPDATIKPGLDPDPVIGTPPRGPDNEPAAGVKVAGPKSRDPDEPDDQDDEEGDDENGNDDEKE